MKIHYESAYIKKKVRNKKMGTFITNEFLYYNDRFVKEHNDFTDDEVFTGAERKEFLARYAEYLKDCYPISEEPKKAVEPEEARELLAKWDLNKPECKVSKRLDITRMRASLRAVRNAYENWHLYTPFADVQRDTLVFAKHHLPPTPSASYSFDSGERLKEITLSFYMSEEYSAEIPGGILDTTAGRTVELRCGTEDLVKLQFYSNGTCYIRLGDVCPYHLENVYLDDYEFGKWQDLTIKLMEADVIIVLNGKEYGPYPLSSGKNPDMLYIGAGMFHVGKWQIKPESLICGEREIAEFFVPAEGQDTEEQFLGEVELPYAVGGYENRDKQLILETEFEAEKQGTYYLEADALDPCGSIYVNGCEAVRTTGFDSQRVDITDYLREGQNHLQVVVEPRAPEVLFNWHRQKDAYNGWFCEPISITKINEIEITNTEVLPVTVYENEICCNFSAYFDKPCQAELFLQKIFPEKEEERSLGIFDVREGELNEQISFEAEPWTVEKPVLYSVRFVALNKEGKPLDDVAVETGFRTIEQRDGRLWLNGKPIVLTGALLMQFLPPYKETPVTHICPRSEQVLWQEMMVKAMGGNTMRIHILGYGTNDERYARYADRLGLLLVWITRYIDSVEQMVFEETWTAMEGYIRQLKLRINHPSIVMWEGSNEFHPSLLDIDRIYRNFVPAVKAADPSRLICPVSHLYYAGDMIPKEGCAFYNDAGDADQTGNPANAPAEWTDPQVVRSAHTYEVLLGYGTDWRKMRTQDWSMQPELYQSGERAYLVTEFAVIGRQNPNVPEAKEYFNPYSYELPNDDVLGFRFTEEEWLLSQAYQALAAKADTQVMRLHDVDAMLWCCLMGGANDGGYLKPPIDNYGYEKLAFHTLKEGFQERLVVSEELDVLKAKDFVLHPVMLGTVPGSTYRVTARIYDESKKVLESREYTQVAGDYNPVHLKMWKPQIEANGYYRVSYELKEEKK